MNKKIIVVGGHMAPALGFLFALPKQVAVIYVGRKHSFEGDNGTSLEYETITKLGVPFINLKTGRLQRRFTSRTLLSLAKIPQGFLQSVRILKKENPDAVVSFGGYLSLPMGIAARLLHIPLIIHESTFRAGLTNKILSSFATKICVSSESSLAYFPSRKTVVTGNPLLPYEKEGITQYLPESKEKLPILLVIGGSAGSHAINKIIAEHLNTLLSSYRVIHQTGDAKEFGDFEKGQHEVQQLSIEQQKRYKIVKYIAPKKVNAVLHAADLVISRAGFNTVTTLITMKKKAILIPLPGGQKNEQLENAKIAEATGYSAILLQQKATKGNLLTVIHDMLLLKINKSQYFSVPLPANGGENLVKEVLLCLRHHIDA